MQAHGHINEWQSRRRWMAAASRGGRTGGPHRPRALSRFISFALFCSVASCMNKPTTEVAKTVSPVLFEDDCQRISNEFGVDAGRTWGFAPAEVRSWWTANDCYASPTTSSDLCQKASDLYGITTGTSGYAPQEVQTWWTGQGCHSVPTASMDICQRAADVYGIAPYDRSSAPMYVDAWWMDNECWAFPQGTDACQKASDLYGIGPVDGDDGFGFAPPEVRTWWSSFDVPCNATPTTSIAQQCQNASNLFLMEEGHLDGAPESARTWWQQNHCNTHPTCQGLSELFGIEAYGPFFGYAPFDPAADDWWYAHNCATTPLFSLDICQRASDTFGIRANVTWGFAPDYVRSFWTWYACNTAPRSPVLFMPDDPPPAPPPPPPPLPAAPTDLVVTGVERCCEHTTSDILVFSFRDHNSASLGYYPSLEVFEQLADGRLFSRVLSYGNGNLGGTRTGEAALDQLYRGANACIKIRYISPAGSTAFSNTACGGVGSTSDAPTPGVGIVNGVHVVSEDFSNWSYYPRYDDYFRIGWKLCNANTTASGPIAVDLLEYITYRDSGSTDLWETYNLSLPFGLAAGECLVQATEPIIEFTHSYFQWNLLINNSWAGGTGMFLF